MAEFDEYITGLMELKLEKKTINADFTISDKRKLKSCLGKGEDITESQLEKIDNTIIDAIHRAYPTSKRVGIEGFYMQNEDEIVETLMIKAGWVTKAKLEEAKTQANKGNKSPN